MPKSLRKMAQLNCALLEKYVCLEKYGPVHLRTPAFLEKHGLVDLRSDQSICALLIF